MPKIIDIKTWERKQHFEHFNAMVDPFFSVTVPVEVTKTYNFAKTNGFSFFATYLHACLKAINVTKAFKLRIVNDDVIEYDTIHASPTLKRSNKTFGFSFVKFEPKLTDFIENLNAEKSRVENSNMLYPPINSLDCIHCSALPWFSFTGHKEPVSGKKDSVPKFAFSKVKPNQTNKEMQVSINVNHALVDGYDVGLFLDAFQTFLNTPNS